MPTYDYFCESCDRNFSVVQVKFKDRKRRRKCKHCGKVGCPQTWDYSKSDDKGIQGIRGGGTPKFYKPLADTKSNEKAWMEKEVKNTEEALKCNTGTSPYSKMSINTDYWEGKGVCKKSTEEEVTKRTETMGKLVRESAQKNMNQDELDIAKRSDRTHSK